MAAAAGTIKSTLNPNAPLFVPAAFQQVEDFSPEWWELVKTTSWFRDYWFHEHQQQEEISTIHHHVEGDDDLAFLLPDSLDLGILEDEEQEEEPRPQLESNKLSSGLEFEGERLIRSLSLRSTKNVGIRHSSKQWEKPAQTFSPRSGERRVIQQPR